MKAPHLTLALQQPNHTAPRSTRQPPKQGCRSASRTQTSTRAGGGRLTSPIFACWSANATVCAPSTHCPPKQHSARRRKRAEPLCCWTFLELTFNPVWFSLPRVNTHSDSVSHPDDQPAAHRCHNRRRRRFAALSRSWLTTTVWFSRTTKVLNRRHPNGLELHPHHCAVVL